MSHVIFEDLTLEQFLRLPEAKPALEFVDGKVLQKVSPKTTHSVIQTLLSARILAHSRPRKLGLPLIEVRCTYGGRSLVSDISFIARGRIPRDSEGRRVDDLFLAPEPVIEIISRGQTVRNLSARLTWCLDQGVRSAWLIQPRRLRVYVFRAGRPVEVPGPGDVLRGEGVLPGFSLRLDETFGWLIED